MKVEVPKHFQIRGLPNANNPTFPPTVSYYLQPNSKRTSMHLCLRISKILSSIFTALDGYDYDWRIPWRKPPSIPWSTLEQDTSGELDTDPALDSEYTSDPESAYAYKPHERDLNGLRRSRAVFHCCGLSHSHLGPFCFEAYMDPVAEWLPHLDGLLALLEFCTDLRTLKVAVHGSFSKPWLDHLENMPAKAASSDRPGVAQVRTLKLWVTALNEKIRDEDYVVFFTRSFTVVHHIRVVLPSNFAHD
ncbi:hypothetical protein C8Q77DRAFT_1210593 [Trametes polyzona]|nr:hypothetical protein C8Q77DRAFT_1210593 [Trametes polyzona]